MPYQDRKSTRLNSSHGSISYAVFCLKKKQSPLDRRCPCPPGARPSLRSLWRRSAARSIFFFFNDTATTEIYTLSLHDALPISPGLPLGLRIGRSREKRP